MGWAFESPRPQKEDAAPFQALPRDCVLHSAPQGLLALARASFLLVPSWAKCTSSCPALLERPSDNLPATLPVCSSSCLGFNLLPVGRKSSSPNPYVAVTAACRLSPSVPDPVSPSLPLCWDCTSVRGLFSRPPAGLGKIAVTLPRILVASAACFPPVAGSSLCVLSANTGPSMRMRWVATLTANSTRNTSNM